MAEVAGASGSFDDALRWAEAAAALRGGGQVVGEADLFVGTLLAHPDPDGEMYRLISHFGLTARDLLPDDFPRVTVESLRRAAAKVGTSGGLPLDSRVTEIVRTVQSQTTGRQPALVDLVGGLLFNSAYFQQALQRGLNRSGVAVTALADDYRDFLSTLNPQVEVAGRALGDRLVQRFPRSPTSLATFSSDLVDPTADFIDIGIEADAFAYLISSRALAPPLAIGLFGDWGSGKSFLMAKIRHRIQQLGDLAGSSNQASLAVWPNVAHIEFNAWEYVETNLWASLLDKIFDELSPTARQKLSDRRRSDTVKKLDTQKLAVTKAEEEVEKLQTAEIKAAGAVQTSKDQVDKVVRTTARLRDSLIAGELESTAGHALVATMVAAGKEELGAEVTNALADVRRAAVATRTSPWLHQKFWTRNRIIYVALAAAVVPAVAFVMNLLSAPPIAGLLASLAPLIPLAALVLRTAASFATNQQEALAAAERTVDKRLAAVVADAKENLEAANKQLEDTQQELATAAETANQARDKQAELEQQRDALTVGNILVEFLKDREASDDYRSKLGLVSKVHQDLQDLAELTAEFNASTPRAPGGPPNRIVLYIDDLDRCPPKKVVEVLEAVHLLLSFPLFVVVVAVDTRWLTSALRTALPAFGQQANVSGARANAMDYVEKIFQIPFWVDPLDDEARRRLLRGLLLPSVAAEPIEDDRRGGALKVGKRHDELVTTMLTDFGSWLDLDARQLSLSVDELAFIESLAPLISGTPRQVKRFVNICQLLLAMAPPLKGEDPTAPDRPTERMATCFMAALHEGLPSLARNLAESPAAATGSLRSTITAVKSVVPPAEVERLEAWLTKQKGLAAEPFDQAPMKLFAARFDLIRRLTFKVGVV